ncbi:MAG TPA: helix-turn-helix domain-containing protein [Bacillota bacterium]|nr:helix-turn-helix domain-containing protein [Bacillota bacterium]
MVGIALREVREERGWARRVIAGMLHISESLVSEWEHGRKRITEVLRTKLARKMDDGRLYLALGREATGGPCVAPWLDGIDGHRLACAMKTIEELEEAIAALKSIMPVLMQPPERISEEARAAIRDTMLEIIECTTASENTCARLARLYGISLADMWDQHQAELEGKGYLKKEKSGISKPQVNLSYKSISSAK